MALVLVWAGWPARAQSEAPEYQIKAALLYKVALFVEWPDRAFESPSSPFVVGVLGGDPFGPWLEQELGGMRIGDHPVEIRRLKRASQGRDCHMVFISRSDEMRLDEVLDELRSMPVLTVSDRSGFCETGGMIGLVPHQNHVRIALNADSAERVGLTISATLQRVALSVYSTPNKGHR